MRKMMMASLLLLLAPLQTHGLQAGPEESGQKKICLTFEKLPFMKPLGFWRPREVSLQILRTLDGAGIKAAGFVVEEKIEEDPSGYVVLEDWISRGHTLGNQTWGDVDLNEISADDFIEHASDGQKSLRKLTRYNRAKYRYMRFPLLHQGNTESKRKDVRKSLSNADYRIAHVTVKTTDWVFNSLYLELEQDPAGLEKLRHLYLQHIRKTLDYAERQSENLLQRQITQILQLRCGIATAQFLPDLIEDLKQRGYSFVTLAEALDDPGYQTEENYIGPLGLTFLDRIAATRGLPFDEESGAALTERDVRQQLKGQ